MLRNVETSLAEFGGDGGQAPHTGAHFSLKDALTSSSSGKECPQGQEGIWTERWSLHLKRGCSGPELERCRKHPRALSVNLSELGGQISSWRRGGLRRWHRAGRMGDRVAQGPTSLPCCPGRTWPIDPRTRSSELGRQPGREDAGHRVGILHRKKQAGLREAKRLRGGDGAETQSS